MTKSTYNLRTILLAVIATAIALSAQAANLSDKDKQFLAGYEKIHTALAADDLASAKTAAGDLGEEDLAQRCPRRLREINQPREDVGGRTIRLLRRALPNAEEGLGADQRENRKPVRRQGNGHLR